MQLYLIRHAQSRNNALPESQRVEDPGITELGHEQAQRLAGWISALRLTRLMTSPFRRALETTAPLSQVTGLSPEVRAEVHEVGGCYRGYTFGELEGCPGMTRNEIEWAFPGFRVADHIDGRGWWGCRPYESHHQALRRASQFVEQIHAEFADTDERVGLVMHADFKLLVLGQIHGGPLTVPCNTSVTTLEVERTGVRMTDFNRVEHLPVEMVSR